MNSPRLAYICFDVVPAPKGAATHIAAFAKALGTVGDLELITVSSTAEAVVQTHEWGQQVALPALGKTLIDRVLYFRQQLGQWLQGRSFDAIQIRSIYEGFPIALRKSQLCRSLIFEVNGLPSIELKYRYPSVVDDRDLLYKLMAQEQLCLDTADVVVTPSAVTQTYLMEQRRLFSNKICVIPNGVDLTLFSYRSPSYQSLSYQSLLSAVVPFRLLYFGTLSAWQGIAIAIEALALCNRDLPTELMILGSARPSQIAALRKQILKLGISEQVQLLPSVPQVELVQYMHKADAIVAPLTANDRNLLQGCCPLKVLEGMASGTPVITSDLPVVNELGENDIHFLAVKPGSPKAIKDAVLRLQTDRQLGQQIAIAARQQIEQKFTWEKAEKSLAQVYASLGIA
jgi:glycosyltransferase involved in cell wall biosynthesis